MANEITRQLKQIQSSVNQIEHKANLIDMMRGIGKTPGGHLTPCDRNILIELYEGGITQSDIARILNVTPAASHSAAAG